MKGEKAACWIEPATSCARSKNHTSRPRAPNRPCARQQKERAACWIEPETSCTRSKNHTSRPIDLDSAARCCAVLDNQVSIVASAPSDYVISSGLLAAWGQNSQSSQAHEGASEMAWVSVRPLCVSSKESQISRLLSHGVTLWFFMCC
jgi:hypothetical protein